MLKTLRENFKHLQWILWLVIAVFVVFVFVDWGMGTTGAAQGNEVAAQGAGFRITTGEFQRQLQETEDRYRQMYGKDASPELMAMLRLPDQVINGLIDRRLMRLEAERLRLSVSDEEVSAEVLGLKDGQGHPLFLKDDGSFIGDAAYKARLARANRSPGSFESEIREQMMLGRLNRFLSTSVFVSDEEVETEFASRNVKAKIAYVFQGAGKIPVNVTDAEAEAAFKANPAAYQLPERRKAKYLLVETAKVKTGISLSEVEVAAEYSNHLDSYRKGEEVTARHILYKSDPQKPESDAAAKTKAEAALKKIKAGADFAELARAESEDVGSKASGGDLGSFGRNRMVKEFEEAAFGAEEGALVGPVKTPYGYHVIQVLKKSGERVQPLFEVAGSIRERLMQQRTQDEMQRIARDLADRAAKAGKPSDDELRRMTGPKVTFNETQLIGRDENDPGVGASPGFNQALFSLEPGKTSEPVQTARGFAVVKLVEVKKAGPATFAEVKARVIADLTKKRLEEGAIESLKQAMAGAASLEDVAQKLGLKVETSESFPKAGPIPGLPASKALLDAAFAAGVGEMKGPISVTGGAVALRPVEKNDLDRAAFERDKDKLRDSIRGQKANQLLQSLINRRRAEMKIEVNRELISRYGKA